MDPKVAAYLKHFSSQSGGELPVFYVRERNQVGQGFRFERNQVGQGIWDVIKRIGMSLLPSLFRGVSSFTSNLADGQSKGLSLKDAAKQSIFPSATNLVKDAATVISKDLTQKQAERENKPEDKPENKSEQQGKGKKVYKRKRKSGKKENFYTKSRKYFSPSGYNF